MKRTVSWLTAFLVFGCALRASAMSIAVGLDWRKGVFVQELWVVGEPQYQIFNATDKAIIIRIYPRAVAQDGKPKMRETLAGPWEIQAKSFVVVRADTLIGKDLVQWELGDGTLLGLLGTPPQKDTPQVPEKPIRSYEGINGSGGRHSDIYLSQKKTSWLAGEIAEFSLTIPAKAGVLKFFHKAEKNDTISIEKLILASAQSDSLEISDDGKAIIIDTAKAKKEQATHAVTLHFKAPDVKAPTLFYFDGWMQIANGGFSISRSIVVVPQKEAQSTPE